MEEETEILDKKGINNRVKVAIRIRPFIEREKVIDDCSCIQVVSHKEIILGNEKLFKFDKVLDENSPQSEVYDSCVRGLVSQCFEGYNSAILAYGQTGSGKTFTMGTTSSKKIPYEDRGILPRVIENIFEEVESNGLKYKYSIKATFLEIYNEHIIDLLSEDHANTKTNKENNMIAIREEKDGSVTIYGANEEEVFSVDDMLELLDRGSFHRTTSSTLMNEASSRSHAIFTISIERNSVDFNNENGIDENYVTSKFVFVDLAGSERLKKTGATGNTLKEGININLGLLELGNVISSLAIEKKESKYINYRNSKLTRILQDSLGGNSNTYMIACVSPAESNYEESLNTIKYASKAMNIKNKPVINRDPQQAHILKLRGIINDLEKENGELKKLMSEKGIDVSKFPTTTAQRAENLTYMSESEEISRLKTKNTILEKKCESLLIENKQETKKSNELEIALYEARRNKDILEIKIEKLLKGESISEDETLYTPIIESYLNKIQFLESEIHEKQKSISQLQIEYSRLYDSSERDAIILTKKNERIFGLERKVKELERRLLERDNVEKEEQEVVNEREVMGRFSRNNKNNGGINNNSNGNNNNNGETEFKSREEEFLSEHQQEQGTIIYDDIDESCLDELESEAHLETDSQYLSEVSNHETEHYKLDTEIKNIERTIKDREAFYADINERQMDLEYKLIEEMKQEYHQKIMMLEKERERLLVSVNNGNNNKRGEKAEDRGKIQSLEGEIKELKKKAKEQKELEKQVTTQSHRLRQLNEEITSFRMQKIELNRKMKEEKDKFNKFKNKRIKELLEAKRENAKKDGQIRKLRNENKKHVQQAIKRKEEMKRMKKVNETLKQLMKPKKLARGSLAVVPEHGRGTDIKSHTMSTSVLSTNERRRGGNNNGTNYRTESELSINTAATMSQDEYDEIVSESIKCLLIQIDRELERQKIWQKCEEIQKEIDELKEEQSELNIKKERLELKKESRQIGQEEVASYVELEKEEEERVILEQLTIKLNEIEERLVNLEEDMEFKSSRYEDLSTNNSIQKQYSHETEVIYNKRYQSVESFRSIIISLYRSIIRLLTENLHIKEQLDTYSYENGILEQEMAKLKEKVYNLTVECQQKIEQAREEYMELKIQLELERESRNNDLAELENYSSIGNETTKLLQPYTQSSAFDKSLNEQQMLKKKYEKKIEELNRNNKQLIKELEIQRKRCETVSDKYNSLKSLLNKDRFIGITVKEEEVGYGNIGQYGNNNNGYNNNANNGYNNTNNTNNNSFSSYRERRHESMMKQQQQQQQHKDMNSINSSNNNTTNITANTNRLISEFNTIQMNNNNAIENNNNTNNSSEEFTSTEQKDREASYMNENRHKKHIYQQNNHNINTNREYHNNHYLGHFNNNNNNNNNNENFSLERRSTQDLEFNKNNWELAAEITNAHKSPILSLTAHDNILASSASKSVALWDLETNEMIHEFSGNPNSTFVKSLNIHPERQIMFTTADRNINVWDLRTFKLEMTLKGHKDEIRLLHINQDALFSAGKGTVNGGSLLVWDLRGSMSFENIVEKEKNQDIFSMTSQNGILYYGTRDHFVRRMKIQNNETLLPFQPPHMDTVTGLATFGDYLISGSKDKNLRLWSLESAMFNLKSTVHSFNDYITCVQNDDYLPLFYASDRSGQIKIGTVIKEKIEFVGGILAHSQQINAICKLNVSPRRGLFATGSSDKSIKLWRPSGQTLEHILNDY